jgi:hypothetical protein
MDKTLQIEKQELIEKIIDRINQERVSFNIYGTSNEDSFLSGINEGIDRVIDALKEFEV